MKRITSALALAALLMAGLAALAPTASAQRYGNLLLDNIESVSDSQAGKQIVNVQVSPVSGCDPRSDLPNGGSFALQPTGTNAGNNDVLELLDSRCNWNITFADAAGQCPVAATLTDADGNNPTDVSNRPGGIFVSVSQTDGTLSSNGVDFVRIHFAIDRSDSNACGDTFEARVNIAVPTGSGYSSAGKNVYAGTIFAVKFSPKAGYGSGCTPAFERNLRITDQGGNAWAAETAGQAASAPRLVNVSLAEKQKTSGSPAGCRYVVSFPSEIKNLARQTSDLDTNLQDRGAADTTSDLDKASAVYAVKTVPVSVIAVFPADEIFTTKDRVAVEVNIARPCGGTLAVLPASIWKQSDRNSVQIFPGEALYLYGSKLAPVSNTARTYAVPAFADVEGTQPCSVTAAISASVARCGTLPVTRTEKYSVGANNIGFRFEFICNGATAEKTSEEAESETSETPPSPPNVNITDGPLPEGRTG